jgi:hypothetical protein
MSRDEDARVRRIRARLAEIGDRLAQAAPPPKPPPRKPPPGPALEEGPLAVIALGPLTNVARALDGRPELRSRVTRVVAVMGRRPGHIFHPAEGGGGGMLLGHGPIFRDFNFEMDVAATIRTVALGIPLTLVPYDAARRIEISTAELDRLAAAGGAAAWVTRRSRAWLAYWQREIGPQASLRRPRPLPSADAGARPPVQVRTLRPRRTRPRGR